MKLNLTLLLLTLMTLMVLSHALTIDKRGEDEDEPDEDEPDENEGGPPPPSHHPQQPPPKAKPVIEHEPKPVPPVAAAPPTKSPSQEHHEEHSSPKKVNPEPEPVPNQVVPALPSVQVEPTFPIASSSIFSYSAPTTTDLLMPTPSIESSTVSSIMPESTDLPPLGISSGANLSFFTPFSVSIATLVFGSTMIVSFWL